MKQMSKLVRGKLDAALEAVEKALLEADGATSICLRLSVSSQDTTDLKEIRSSLVVETYP